VSAEILGTPLDQQFGVEARNRLADATMPGLQGAVAALESFYAAFNGRDLELLGQVWGDGPLVQLNNPLGGILRGQAAIRALYGRVLGGNVRVWVAFSDIVAYPGGDMVVFAGRENGEFQRGGVIVPLSIRTSRVFACAVTNGRRRWVQVHHHGSIDDPHLLERYIATVRGEHQEEVPAGL